MELIPTQSRALFLSALCLALVSAIALVCPTLLLERMRKCEAPMLSSQIVLVVGELVDFLHRLQP